MDGEPSSISDIILLINDYHTGTFSILEIDTSSNVIASEVFLFTIQKYEHNEYKLILEFTEDIIGYLNCKLEQRILNYTSESPDDAWGAVNVYTYTFESMDRN